MVRYADRPTVELSVDIAASTAVVWDLVTDINMPARFSDEFRGADWIDDAAPHHGARFIGRNRHRTAGEWQTTCTVTWFEPHRSFGYSVNDVDDPAARWRFDLAPNAQGTKLTMWAQMGPGRSGLTSLIKRYPDREEEIVANRLTEWHTNMEATLAGIKAVAEAG